MRLSKTKRREMRFITIPPKKTKEEIRKARNKRKSIIYSVEIKYGLRRIKEALSAGSKGHHDGDNFTGMNLGIYKKWGS